MSHSESATRVVVLLGSLRGASLNRRIAETLRHQVPAAELVAGADRVGQRGVTAWAP